MERVYISVGSNIEPLVNVVAAIEALSTRIEITGVSTFYESPAIDSFGKPSGQATFVNGVVRARTDIPPRELKFGVLRAIEEELGRVRTSDKFAPRTVDLDIIVYGDQIVSDSDLVIPDFDIATRPFLAVPLLELEPDIRLPGSDVNLRDAAYEMDKHLLTPLVEFSRRLREEYCR